jgi:hypothetical protein
MSDLGTARLSLTLSGAPPELCEYSAVSACEVDDNRNARSDTKVESYGKWLSHADPSTNHGLAHRYHHEETSQWLVKGNDDKNDLDEWKRKGTLFFVHGRCKWLVVLKIS